MALDNFGRINLPYGMMRNDKDEWMIFNRDYKALGCRDRSAKLDYENPAMWVKYENLTEKKLLSFHHPFIDRGGPTYDSEGKITQVYFYTEGDCPFTDKNQYKRYFKVLEELSRLKVDMEWHR